MIFDLGQILVLVFNPGLPDAMAQLRVGLMIALRRKSLMHDQIVLFVDDVASTDCPPRVWAVRDFPPMLADCGLTEIIHAREVLQGIPPEHRPSNPQDAGQSSTRVALALSLLKPRGGYPGRSVVIPEHARESVQDIREIMNWLQPKNAEAVREIIVYRTDGSLEIL